MATNAQAGLECQLEIYRRISGAERLAIALRLHELACEMAREGIRQQFPAASRVEVEKRLKERLLLAHELSA